MEYELNIISVDTFLTNYKKGIYIKHNQNKNHHVHVIVYYRFLLVNSLVHMYLLIYFFPRVFFQTDYPTLC